MNFRAIIHALLQVIKCNYKQLRRIAFVACSDSVHLQHIIQNQIKAIKTKQTDQRQLQEQEKPLTLNLSECWATKALISCRRESLARKAKKKITMPSYTKKKGWMLHELINDKLEAWFLLKEKLYSPLGNKQLSGSQLELSNKSKGWRVPQVPITKLCTRTSEKREWQANKYSPYSKL